MPAIDQHDTILGQDNPGVGIELLTHININAVFDFFDLRTEILS